MKRKMFVAAVGLMMAGAAAAQEVPPPPPKPPLPPVENVRDAPPPPEAPMPPEAPPPPAISPIHSIEAVQPPDDKDFLKRNPSVQSLNWTIKNELIIHFKSGKEERYNLNDKKSRKEAETKYGKLPVAPPPPPPNRTRF